ncbi:MAG: efflux RND transporter periplasmic adaptor subunit [Nitrospirae bacterium]|nr:efflux RND transporter periplasmic adaptor subunit [Nitrospirota bacterium]
MANEDLSKLRIEKTAGAAGQAQSRKPAYRVAALLLIIAIIGLLYLKGVFTPAVQIEAAGISRTYPSQAFTLLNASGYVVAQRKSAVASKVTGRLVSISVEEGSKVKKGEIIARLENEDVTANRNQVAANLNVARANLEQARAELQNARISFDREKALLQQGYTTQADYDAAEARYKKAAAVAAGAEAAIKANTAALHGADVALEYTLIRAPFDAVVLTKNAEVGDIVTPIGAAVTAKASVFTIADMSSLQVEADVSESNLEVVKAGQPCEIQLDALPGSRFRGEVHMIVPTADRAKATVMTKVRFIDKDSRILPEMSAKVAFLSRPVSKDEEKPLTTIKPAALVTRDGKNYVFLIKGDHVVLTPVTLGEQIGDLRVVLGGVKPGDRVATKPLDKLKDGSKVKIAEK